MLSEHVLKEDCGAPAQPFPLSIISDIVLQWDLHCKMMDKLFYFYFIILLYWLDEEV